MYTSHHNQVFTWVLGIKPSPKVCTAYLEPPPQSPDAGFYWMTFYIYWEDSNLYPLFCCILLLLLVCICLISLAYLERHQLDHAERHFYILFSLNCKYFAWEVLHQCSSGILIYSLLLLCPCLVLVTEWCWPQNEFGRVPFISILCNSFRRTGINFFKSLQNPIANTDVWLSWQCLLECLWPWGCF